MEHRTIVGVEISSSKIKGGLGTVDADGRLNVVAVEEIPGINNVRYGRIQNIREVSAAVNEIIRRFEAHPAIAPRKVDALVLSIGGRSLTGVPARASLRFPTECEITDEHVKRLRFEATRDFVGDKNVEACVARMYYVNNTAVRRVVGTFGDTLRGEFMMITCGKETHQNLSRLKIENIDPERIYYLIRPMAVAELALNPDEKEVGTVLVDFGAETTTVSIYKDSSLVFLSTLPMGSRLLTLDLVNGMGITEEAAENFKVTIGNADPSAPAINDNPNADEVNCYIRARAAEISANIINQIDLSGYTSDNLANIVLCGGGSKLPGFASQLSARAKMPVRLAVMPPDISFSMAGRNNADNIDIVALLASAARYERINCVEPEPEVLVEEVPVVPEPEIFEQAPAEPALAAAQPQPEMRTAEPRTEASSMASVRDEMRPRPPQEEPRRILYDDDDDDNILRDDDDENYNRYRNKPPKTSRGGISSWFKKKSKPKEDYFDDEYDLPEEPTENVLENTRLDIDKEPAPEPKPHEASSIIQNISKRMVNIFMPPTDGDDDDDDL